MTDATTIHARLAWVAAGCLALALFITGFMGPVFSAMLHDFGATDTAPLWMRMLSRTHWAWTTPLGLCAGALLIAGSKRWPGRITRAIAVAVLLTMLLWSVAVLLLPFLRLPKLGGGVSSVRASHPDMKI